MEYKINTLLPIQFEKIENPPYLNDSRFQAVRCYVAHEKENYNGSYFDLSVLEAMGKKMAGVPIVGYISVNNVNEKDFNGHEQRLIVDDNGVSIEYLGRAYGCVISNDDVTIVDRMHEDGKMRKYLCVTGVLWKMFTDCIDIFDRDTSKGHSMELQEDSIKGNFEKDGYYHFTDATVRALCILGEGILPAMSNSVIEKFSQENIDKDIQELLKEVNESIKQFSKLQPKIDSYWIEKEKAEELVSRADNIFKKLGFECLEWVVDGKEYQITGIINKTINEEASKCWGFPIYNRDTISIHTNDIDQLDTSSISISSVELLLSKKDNIQNFSLIPKKLEQSDSNIDSNRNGGNNLVEEKLKLITKYGLTVEQLNFNIEEITLEQLEEKLKEFTTAKPKVAFSATYRQKREALQNALDPKIEKDADGNVTYEEYLWVEDFDDSVVFVEKSIWTPDNYERKYGRFAYTFNEETLTATITGEFEEMVLVWLTIEENQKLQEERNAAENYEKLKGEFDTYKQNYSTPNDEVIRLQKFESDILAAERKEAEEALFEEFKDLEGIQEYEEIKEKISEYELDAFEKECFAIRGKMNSKFSVKNFQKKQGKVKIEFSKKNEEKVGEFDELFNKYLKKD